MGMSPGGVAAHLNVTREMVYYLCRTQQLDVVELQDKTGSMIAWICSDNSVDKYYETKATKV